MSAAHDHAPHVRALAQDSFPRFKMSKAFLNCMAEWVLLLAATAFTFFWNIKPYARRRSRHTLRGHRA